VRPRASAHARLKHDWALLPLGVRGLEASSFTPTIFAELTCALVSVRTVPLAA
jgi:hypothetical protein